MESLAEYEDLEEQGKLLKLPCAVGDTVALTSLSINCSYDFRVKIAKANGIGGYVGTAAQNTRMYNLLVAGLLRRVLQNLSG